MTEPNWKELALFLADCQAATAQGLNMLKSGSKSEKRRHRDICKMAADCIEGLHWDRRTRPVESIVARLRSGQKEPEK